MEPSFANLAILIAALYPAFIVSFLFIASIFNMKKNGLVYLAGLLFTIGFCALIGEAIGSPRNSQYTCDIFTPFGYDYKSPSYNVAITWFTFIYLLLPMLQNINLLNPVVIALTAIFAVINMFYLVARECTNMFGALIGLIIGLGCGSIWYGIWSYDKSLLFYDELVSNNVLCERPAKQTFKCHVYKNGEIISSSVV